MHEHPQGTPPRRPHLGDEGTRRAGQVHSADDADGGAHRRGGGHARTGARRRRGLQVITKEAKKRAESAEAFSAAGRDELAAQERAEGEILARYLPQQLGDDELAALCARCRGGRRGRDRAGAGPRQMGQVMKKAQAAAAGRADGKRVSAAVKALLVAPQ
jgi:uncharacterized protein YqeY